ncbi:MAG: alpha/beta hydrolase [bacterium]|nr:alpha/beta hydrolase [Candidatus Aquidulcis sp.]
MRSRAVVGAEEEDARAAHAIILAKRVTALLARRYPHHHELPGFGLSEKSWERDYSHKAQATFALAALDQLNVDRAVLLGHSMGGNVISWMLALAPERVAGLAYIDAAVAQPRSGVSSSPSTAEALLGVPPIRRLARIVIRSAFTPATFGELLSSAFAVTSAVTPTLVTGYAASAQLRDWDLALLGIIRDSAKNSLPDSLANLTAAAGEPPTLILWGEADSWVPLRSGEVLRADLPAAEWVVLPGIGHVPFEEDVPTFIGVVGGWLDALR